MRVHVAIGIAISLWACDDGQDEVFGVDESFVTTNQYAPIGVFDSLDSSGVARGWACDKDSPTSAIAVHFYTNSSTTFLGSATANQASESAINTQCAGGTAHRFTFQVPSSAAGKTIELWGIDTVSGNAWLGSRVYQALCVAKCTNVACGASNACGAICNPGSGCIADAYDPIGYFDTIDASGRALGWSCDQDTPTQSNRVRFYTADAAHTYLGEAIANSGSEAGVNSACGGGTAHRFSFQLTAALRGKNIEATGIDTAAGSKQLTASPKLFAMPPGYAGCFTDSSTRALPVQLGSNHTVETCKQAAYNAGYRYAGVQYYGSCFAGDTLGYSAVASSECNTPCTANPSQMCGGAWRNSIYETGLRCGDETANALAVPYDNNRNPVYCQYTNAQVVDSANKTNGAVSTLDHIGCDIDAPNSFSWSCGSRGGDCCDEHDACYRDLGCTGLSWIGLQGRLCFTCNLAVLACMRQSTGNSVCCGNGDCGQAWGGTGQAGSSCRGDEDCAGGNYCKHIGTIIGYCELRIAPDPGA